MVKNIAPISHIGLTRELPPCETKACTRNNKEPSSECEAEHNFAGLDAAFAPSDP